MLKKRKQPRQFICPHTDCQVSFLTPIIEKGILFCPHCERSLLVDAPISLDEVNKQSIDSHKKQKKLIYQYLVGALAWVVSDIVVRKYVKPDVLVKMMPVIILFFTGFMIFKLYKYYRNRLSYRIKHKKIAFIAGVDRLADIYQLIDIKKYYVDNKGMLLQRQHVSDNIKKPVLYSCPHCTSQMMVKLPQMVNWQRSLYEKYNISRPETVPSCEYSRDTDRYISSDSVLSHIFLCLHCHTHYSWADIETGDLFKSVEGAPQLHKI